MASYHSSPNIDVCFYTLFDDWYELPSKEKIMEKMTELCMKSSNLLDFCHVFETFCLRMCAKHVDFATLSLMSVKSSVYGQTHFSLLSDATLQFFIMLAEEVERLNVNLPSDFYENFEQKAMQYILFNNVKAPRVGRVIHLLRHVITCIQGMRAITCEDTKYCSCATYAASGDCHCTSDME